jgi:phage shock protein C
MQTAQPSLFLRDDTFFGVCEALGEDFGFNPLFLRITFAVALIWNPVAVVAAYLGAGVVVAASRWLVPNARLAAAPQPSADAAHEAPMMNNDDVESEALAVAA